MIRKKSLNKLPRHVGRSEPSTCPQYYILFKPLCLTCTTESSDYAFERSNMRFQMEIPMATGNSFSVELSWAEDALEIFRAIGFMDFLVHSSCIFCLETASWMITMDIFLFSVSNLVCLDRWLVYSLASRCNSDMGMNKVFHLDELLYVYAGCYQ